MRRTVSNEKRSSTALISAYLSHYIAGGVTYRVPNRPSGDFGVVKGLRPITQPREPRRDCPRSKHRDRVPEFKKRERTVGARTKVCARGEVATGRRRYACSEKEQEVGGETLSVSPNRAKGRESCV